MLFWLILGHFWCSVVTLVTFSSNLNNFEKIQTKIQKIQKNPKKIQNLNKLQQKNIYIYIIKFKKKRKKIRKSVKNRKIQKNHFFFKSEIFENIFFSPNKKMLCS